MARETEKVFKAFDEYMKDHGEPESEDELNDMLHAFMQEYNSSIPGKPELSPANATTSDDYLELAESADTLEEAVRFSKKALKLDPDNLDAEAFVAVLSAKDHFDRIKNWKRQSNTAMK